MSRKKVIYIGITIFLVFTTAGIGTFLFMKVFKEKCFEICTEEE